VSATLDPPNGGTAARVPVSLTSAAPGYSAAKRPSRATASGHSALTVQASDGSQQTVAQPIDVS